MKLLRLQRGQSTAEYAVLFAIVIGAAIAMQQYVKGRLQAAVGKQADAYATAAGVTKTFDDQNRTTHSKSTSGLTMTTALKGVVGITSDSNTTQKK